MRDTNLARGAILLIDPQWAGGRRKTERVNVIPRCRRRRESSAERVQRAMAALALAIILLVTAETIRATNTGTIRVRRPELAIMNLSDVSVKSRITTSEDA